MGMGVGSRTVIKLGRDSTERKRGKYRHEREEHVEDVTETGRNTVLESIVSNTKLSESFGSHRVLGGGELSESLSAYTPVTTISKYYTAPLFFSGINFITPHPCLHHIFSC